MNRPNNINSSHQDKGERIGGMLFCSTIEQVRSNPNLIGNLSAVERAWTEMQLDGVLFVDTRPVLFRCTSEKPLAIDKRIHLHRLFWNQGMANVLILRDPQNVHIYSGLAEPVAQGTPADQEKARVETLTLAEYANSVADLFHEIATGHYYRTKEHARFFRPQHSMDTYLMYQLRGLRDRLIEGKDEGVVPKAHAFMGRVLFVCYLLDRKITFVPELEKQERLSSKDLSAALKRHTDCKAKLDFLYDLFLRLKKEFNGTLFDQDLDAERQQWRTSDMRALEDFLAGHQIHKRYTQYTLGFWAYDFKMIPVETISAIYEDFLKKEDPARKNKSGAFYTPRFLAEMVVDICAEDRDMRKMRFLDPACGSGIFLVTLFNRLAKQWMIEHPDASYKESAEALRGIMQNQLRGIDINETACRITCFSLYLAYLDSFDPPDIREHVERTGQYLPKLLDYGDSTNAAKPDIPVVRCGNFLADETLCEPPFDVVIGNPPWTGRSGKQLARQFVERSKHYLKNDAGVGCMLLPSKLLLNSHSNNFQASWMRKMCFEKIIQMADYSFLLFEQGMCPCTLVRFANRAPDNEQSHLEFSAPKFSLDTRRRGAITVRPQDRAWLSQKRLIAAADADIATIEWKRYLWGTPRDQKLLDLLLAMPNLNDQVDVLSNLRKKSKSRGKPWCTGKGIKPWKASKTSADRPPKPMRWNLDAPFLATDGWNADLLIMSSDTTTLERRFAAQCYRTDVLYSAPPNALFYSPMVLVSEGVSDADELKVAYCNFPVLFQHSLQSITGPNEDASLLKFLAAYLRSKLAKYFLFHTSANWGTERDKVHLHELLKLPFPLPGNEFASEDAYSIVETIAAKMDDLRVILEQKMNQGNLLHDGKPTQEWQQYREKRTQELQAEMEPLICRYFGLIDQEVAVIDDTVNIAIPSSTPTKWDSDVPAQHSVAKTTVSGYEGGLTAYAETLAETLNEWAAWQESEHRVNVEGGIDDSTGLACVTVMLAESSAPFHPIDFSGGLAEKMQAYLGQATERSNTLEYPRDVFWFDGPSIHIIRPDVLINWTRTTAQNDAARIYGEIAERRRRQEVTCV